MIGKDKEEDDCPFENHPWVSPHQIRRYTKKFNEWTICVNHKRRYLGPLKFYNLLNKWKLEDLKSYTKAKRKRTPAACPRAKNGKILGNPEIKKFRNPGNSQILESPGYSGNPMG